jgi:hypothetical protein
MRDPKAAEVAVRPWVDQAVQAGSRGRCPPPAQAFRSGVVILCIHRCASCGLRCPATPVIYQSDITLLCHLSRARRSRWSASGDGAGSTQEPARLKIKPAQDQRRQQRDRARRQRPGPSGRRWSGGAPVPPPGREITRAGRRRVVAGWFRCGWRWVAARGAALVRRGRAAAQLGRAHGGAGIRSGRWCCAARPWPIWPGRRGRRGRAGAGRSCVRSPRFQWLPVTGRGCRC